MSSPESLRGLIPGCRLLVDEGAPHGVMFTHMDQLHADILQFVRETPERNAFRPSSRVRGGPLVDLVE